MVYIIDENLVKVDIIRKYTIWEYYKQTVGTGTFSVTIPVESEQKYLLDRSKTYFILFQDADDSFFGKIQKVEYTSDEEVNRGIVISGRSGLFILQKRVINGTLNYSGLTWQYIRNLIQNYVTSSSRDGHITGSVQAISSSVLAQKCSSITRQVTGGYVWDEIEEVAKIDNLCIGLVPYSGVEDGDPKITNFRFTISPGYDRTRGNTEGNLPVVFSQSLSNIQGAEYSRDTKGYTNVAYAAGEGEGADRKWYTANRSEAVTNPWLREELWIDARDVQSEDEHGGTLTDEEYEELIMERVNEKFSENDLEESYTSTLVSTAKNAVYGTDYFLGDFVTVRDIELGIEVDAQITGVTVTEYGSRKIYDPEFTYGKVQKDPVNDINDTKTKVERQEANIKYIENQVIKNLRSFEEVSQAVAEQGSLVLELQSEIPTGWTTVYSSGNDIIQVCRVGNIVFGRFSITLNDSQQHTYTMSIEARPANGFSIPLIRNGQLAAYAWLSSSGNNMILKAQAASNNYGSYTCNAFWMKAND